jgi:YHS domain-containing protein
MHEVKEPETFFDVVCGMELTPDKIKHTVEHTNGTAYHFCSKLCKDHFVNDSQKYIG